MLDPTQPQYPEPITAPAQTTQNLDGLLQKAEGGVKTSTWGYIIWGLALPPITTILALLFALKRGVFFVVLPTLTIAFSALAVLSPIFVYFLFGPIHIVTTQFTLRQNIYADVGLALTSMFLTILAIAGIILGVYFRNKAKKALTLGTIPVVVLLVILVLEHWIFWINLNSAMSVVSKQAQIILNQQGVPF